MSSVALVGHMVASTQGLERLREELEGRGHAVRSFLANGKHYQAPLEEILGAVRASDAVVLGMASGADIAAEELAALDAANKAVIPVALYSDTYGSWARPHFEAGLRDLTTGTLFVLNHEEAARAREAYPHFAVVASGNPVWEDFFFPAITREQARKRLGVSEDIKVIFVPWGKDPVVNILHAGGVVEAALVYGIDAYFLVAVGLHPGDKTPKEFYQSLTISTEAPVRLVEKAEMPSGDILMAADLVVESASTLGIQAAHLRIPVIDYFTEIALRRMEQSIGTRWWEPCTLGVAVEVRANISLEPCADLCKLITALLDDQSERRTELLARQAEVYPRPQEKGTAVRLMADVLERMM